MRYLYTQVNNLAAELRGIEIRNQRFEIFKRSKLRGIHHPVANKNAVLTHKVVNKLFDVKYCLLPEKFWGCQIQLLNQQQSKQSKRKKPVFRLGLEDLLRIFQLIQSKDRKRRDKRRGEQGRFKQWILRDKFYAIFLV